MPPIFVSYDDPGLTYQAAANAGQYKMNQDAWAVQQRQQQIQQQQEQLNMEQQRINNQQGQFGQEMDFHNRALQQQWDTGARAHDWEVQDRATATASQSARDAAQHGYRMDEIYGKGQNAADIANIRAGAQVDSANIRAGATTQSSQIRADASQNNAALHYANRLGVDPATSDAMEQRRQINQARLNHQSMQAGLLNQMKILQQRPDFYDPTSQAAQQHDALFQQYQENERNWRDFLTHGVAVNNAGAARPIVPHPVVQPSAPAQQAPPPQPAQQAAPAPQAAPSPGPIVNVNVNGQIIQAQVVGSDPSGVITVQTPRGQFAVTRDQIVGNTAPPSQPPPPTQADLEYTAQKYGITVDEVKRRLGM